MESFLPSEIGRLIYGYLQTQCGENLADEFLNSCDVMKECRLMKQIYAKKFHTKVQDLSLEDILNQYSILCSLIFQNTESESLHKNVFQSLKNTLNLEFSDVTSNINSNNSKNVNVELNNLNESIVRNCPYKVNHATPKKTQVNTSKELELSVDKTVLMSPFSRFFITPAKLQKPEVRYDNNKNIPKLHSKKEKKNTQEWDSDLRQFAPNDVVSINSVTKRKYGKDSKCKKKKETQRKRKTEMSIDEGTAEKKRKNSNINEETLLNVLPQECENSENNNSNNNNNNNNNKKNGELTVSKKNQSAKDNIINETHDISNRDKNEKSANEYLYKFDDGFDQTFTLHFSTNIMIYSRD
ncbi:hypothetical protein PGB90_005476 [Kerria lacca]